MENIQYLWLGDNLRMCTKWQDRNQPLTKWLAFHILSYVHSNLWHFISNAYLMYPMKLQCPKAEFQLKRRIQWNLHMTYSASKFIPLHEVLQLFNLWFVCCYCSSCKKGCKRAGQATLDCWNSMRYKWTWCYDAPLKMRHVDVMKTSLMGR